MITIATKFFEPCATCTRHSDVTSCCCDTIGALQRRVQDLEDVVKGNEKFSLVVKSQQENLDFADVVAKADWCEIALSYEQRYRDELETALIDAQVEQWLARELLSEFGISSDVPLREAIMQLAKLKVRKL